MTHAVSVASTSEIPLNIARENLIASLTPELSRTAARNGGVVHVTM